MRKTRRGSGGIIMALVVGWMALWVPSPTHAAPASTPDRRAMGFDELIDRAEQEQADAKYEDAARSFAAAYNSLSIEDRVGLKGEIAVDNALASYRLAYQIRPALALLEQPVRLLEEFAEARGQAHLAGQAQAVPLRLRAELARAQKRLEDARASSATESAGSSTGPTDSEQPPWSSPDQPYTPKQRGADIALVTSGLVSLATGVVLFGRGAWYTVQVERLAYRRLDGLLDRDLSRSKVTEYQSDIADWRRRNLRFTRSLLVTGSVFAATGAALTLWGGIRMVRHSCKRRSKRRVRVGLPVTWGRQVDVAVTIAF